MKPRKRNLSDQHDSKHKKHQRTPIDNIIRIPRPLGITVSLIQHHKTQKEQTKYLQQAKKLIIQHWSTNNFTICEKPYSLPELTEFIQMNTKDIIGLITRPIMQWLSKGDIEDNYRALIASAIFGAQADKALAMRQFKVFEKAQLNTDTGELEYRPFISDAASRHISVINGTTKTIMEAIKMLKPEPKPKALEKPLANPEPKEGETPMTTESGKYIGVTEAVRLLEQANSPLDKPEKVTILLEQHASEPLPEIKATKQQGISADGLEKKQPKKKHKSLSERIANSSATQEVIIA